GRISRRTGQADAPSLLGPHVAIKLGLRRVLRNGEIHATIAVEIADGGPTLLAIGLHTGELPGHGAELPLAIAPQPQSATGVVAGSLAIHREKILAQEN